MRFKRHRSFFVILLMLIGMGYFSSVSTLESGFLLKSLGILLPIQVGGTLYLLYLYWMGKIPGTARHEALQQRNDQEKLEKS